jgi:hypothetical protein
MHTPTVWYFAHVCTFMIVCFMCVEQELRAAACSDFLVYLSAKKQLCKWVTRVFGCFASAHYVTRRPSCDVQISLKAFSIWDFCDCFLNISAF